MPPFPAALCGALALTVPLVLWRLGFAFGDWAALALMALGLLLFRSHFQLSLARHRATLPVVLTAHSRLRALMRGPLRAGIQALALVCVTLPVLAWQSLTAPPERLAVLLALCLSASYASARLVAPLRRHLTLPFAGATARRGATLLMAALFLPVLTWLDYALTAHPAALRDATLGQAVLARLDALPPRGGGLTEAMALFHAFEALQLWLVMQLDGTPWPGLALAFSGALAAGAVAVAAVTLTGLFLAHEDLA